MVFVFFQKNLPSLLCLRRVDHAQTFGSTKTRRRLGLQSVCFSKDVSLKNVCAPSSWCRHGLTSLHLFSTLKTYQMKNPSPSTPSLPSILLPSTVALPPSILLPSTVGPSSTPPPSHRCTFFSTKFFFFSWKLWNQFLFFHENYDNCWYFVIVFFVLFCCMNCCSIFCCSNYCSWQGIFFSF